jgi:ATP-binding cassette subfamily B protein
MSTNKATLRLLWNHLSKYPRYVVGVFVAAPLTVLIQQFLPPLILARVLNRLGTGDYQAHNIWASFGKELIAYAVVLLFGGVVMWRIVDYFGWQLEANIERDIARRIFRHLLGQSANFHANRFSGSLVSQTNKLLGAYIRFADTTIYSVIPLISSLIIASVILARHSPLYVLVLNIIAIIFVLIAIVISRSIRVLRARVAEAESKQTGYLADTVTNILAVKSFAGTRHEEQEFNAITDNIHGLTLDTMRGSQRQMISFGMVTNTLQFASLLLAVIGVLVYKINLAAVFLMVTYTANIASQLFSFGNNALKQYNRAFGDAAEMVEILQLEPEVKDPQHPEKSRIQKGQVTFDHVTFSHEGAGSELFTDLSLNIKAGEKVGIVGHSGSGKTSLTRLLLRFSDVDGGSILIDGQNIAHLTQDELHKHIAYVPQEPIMFHRTLAENIRYGDFDATQAEIVKAAKLAHADDFIRELPEGYKTLVGERGVKLSGGQRQRIAIARAMLKQAPVLVLDEATSALDSESEHLIQDALWRLMQGKTAVVIAHRLSTIQKLDRIIVLHEGAIAEEGTHHSLLKHKGIYAQLWQRQSGGFLDE